MPQNIIVIGAGMAGLAAAKRLVNEGHRVTILEGRDRIGGRTYTSHQWADFPADLGASWIHGIERNPITALAEELGTPMVVTDYNSGYAYHSDGRPFSDRHYTQLENVTEQIIAQATPIQRAGEDTSLHDVLHAAIEGADLTDKERKLAEFSLNTLLEHEYSGSLKDMSARWFDDDGGFDGDDVILPEGYGVIVDFLAEGLKVELNQIVTGINWGDEAVTVHTADTSYTADKVIVTLPLGVLKKGNVTFTPALPAPKQTAIAKLLMGTYNKCYFRFPEIFWPKRPEWLEYVSDDLGHWAEWFSMANPFDLPILIAFNAADFGREVELLSDEEIVADAMNVLRTVFGDDIPDPEDYIITRWVADPFSCGSYSFNSVGSHPDMRDDLAAPLSDRLFFAGEATHREYFATVHGAYISGLRAADEAMEG